MLVKKKNPEWKPSENPGLRVGETIEITDPKSLIMSGDVIAMSEDGSTEISAYELYGILVKDEVAEFEEYLKVKKAESQKAALEKEQKELEAQLAATQPVEAPVAATPAPAATATVKATELKKGK